MPNEECIIYWLIAHFHIQQFLSFPINRLLSSWLCNVNWHIGGISAPLHNSWHRSIWSNMYLSYLLLEFIGWVSSMEEYRIKSTNLFTIWRFYNLYSHLGIEKKLYCAIISHLWIKRPTRQAAIGDAHNWQCTDWAGLWFRHKHFNLSVRNQIRTHCSNWVFSISKIKMCENLYQKYWNSNSFELSWFELVK